MELLSGDRERDPSRIVKSSNAEVDMSRKHAPMTDRIQALERIARLLDEGKLSRTEYDALKEEVLNSSERSPHAAKNLESRNAGLSRPTESPTRLIGEPGSPVMRWLGRVDARPQNPARKRILGWVLVSVGALGALATGVVEFNQASGFQLSAFWFGLLINPLVWLGIVGGYLVDKARSDERRRL